MREGRKHDRKVPNRNAIGLCLTIREKDEYGTELTLSASTFTKLHRSAYKKLLMYIDIGRTQEQMTTNATK
jgi:hypothetical protein